MQCMQMAGILRMEHTYQWFKRETEKLKGPIGFVGHSQPPSHFLRLACNNPEKFPVVFSVAGAHFGSQLATRRILSQFPCSHDLAPNSAYLLEVQAEFAEMRASLPQQDQPRVVCIVAYRDGIVLPWHSGLIPGAENYVLARQQPDKLPHDAVWIPTRHELNHFSIIRDSEALGIMSQLLEGPYPRQLETDQDLALQAA